MLQDDAWLICYAGLGYYVAPEAEELLVGGQLPKAQVIATHAARLED